MASTPLDRLMEADAGAHLSYATRRDAALAAFKKMPEYPKDDNAYVWVRDIYEGSVIFDLDSGIFKQYAYTIDDAGTVTLSDPQEVMASYTPLDKQSVAEASIIEAINGDGRPPGSIWRIRVLRGGVSANGNMYSDKLLRESVGKVNGARVFMRSDDDHLSFKRPSVSELIGGLDRAEFVEGRGGAAGEIHADLKLISPTGQAGTMLREAWDRGLTGLFGFSIVATGKATKRKDGSRWVREAKSLEQIISVDMITFPSAGGAVIDMVEAQKTTHTIGERIMDREELIEALNASGHGTEGDISTFSDAALKQKMIEAVSKSSTQSKPASGTDDADNGNDTDMQVVTEAVKDAIQRQSMLAEALTTTQLPAAAQARVRAQFKETVTFTEADVQAAIKGESDYLAAVAPGGAVFGLGAGRAFITEGRDVKVADMLDAFFDPEHKNHRHATSFKEAYRSITGDANITGALRDCDTVLMAEALGTDQTFSSVLGSAMHRRMLKEYSNADQFDVWKHVASISSVADFRDVHLTRFGGYGDIPKVEAGADYTALTSPGDEETTMSVDKYGGLEKVTLEMIANDDQRAIQRIPVRMAKASKRTLGKFVLDMIATNPKTGFDKKALFHTDHGNLMADALTADAYAKARLKMLQQQEYGTKDQTGVSPSIMLLPFQLEQTAYDLFRRDTNHDETFVQSQKPTVVSVWYWTDPNDWYVLADPSDIETIAVAFKDGKREPEMFVQDNPTVGSLFTNDTITYKIRHIYGGAITDWRGAVGSIVA